MNLRVSGAFATATIFALTGAASAQSTTNFYQQIQSGYQQGVIAPAATSTYQATPSTTFNNGGSAYAPSTNFATSQGSAYLPQPQNSYAQPTASTFGSQQVGTSYIPAPTTTTTVQQPAVNFSATTPSYASPYTPTTQPGFAPSIPPTYVAPGFGTANAIYQGQQLPSYQAQQLPVFQQPGFNSPTSQQPIPLPATAVAPNQPTTPKPSANGLPDSDGWSFNLARFYPAIQACLRKSSAKNPVIANVQVSDQKTKMLIGEGGSSTFSICSTGLSGTVVKANSDIRSLPAAFFAPLGSTFTVSPDRPFQPVVDTDQKVIGWLVRTKPSTSVNQFGQAPNFDGQFIRPMMVNTSVGKG